MPDSPKGLIGETIKTKFQERLLMTKHLTKPRREKHIIQRLREEDVFYFKADKSNKTVISDKADYNERIISLINIDPYIKSTENLLPKMI